MSRLMDKRITRLEVKMNKSLKELKDQAEQSSQRDIAQDRDLKQSVYKLIQSSQDEIKSVKKKVDNMDDNIN